MSRVELEKQARELGLEIDGKTDKQLRDAIEEKGAETQASNEPQDGRFDADGNPVDGEGEFKKNPGMDKIKQKVKASEKLFPVKLVRNYRPISPEFQILGEGGIYRVPTEEERYRIKAGESIALPVSEAQSVVEKKIAERNDPIR